METVKFYLGKLLGLLPLPFALILLFGTIVWVSVELAAISTEKNFLTKFKYLARAVLIALTGSYFGGLYTDGLDEFPAELSSMFIIFVIALASLTLLPFFARSSPDKPPL